MWTFPKRLLAAGAMLVLLLAFAGVVYQHAATVRDLRRFPPPGEMQTVEGRRLHSLVQGEGGPTVVFDAPVGVSSVGWALVQPDVATFAQTFAYDRAGYGWSDPGPRPRTSVRMVDELHELLRNSRVPNRTCSWAPLLVGATSACTPFATQKKWPVSYSSIPPMRTSSSGPRQRNPTSCLCASTNSLHGWDSCVWPKCRSALQA